MDFFCENCGEEIFDFDAYVFDLTLETGMWVCEDCFINWAIENHPSIVNKYSDYPAKELAEILDIDYMTVQYKNNNDKSLREEEKEEAYRDMFEEY